MTPPEEDDSLRRAFRTMARHDARRTPELQALRARATPRPAWQVVVPAASALALAACVLIGFSVTLPKRDARSPVAAASPSPAAKGAAHGTEAAPAASAAAPSATASAVGTAPRVSELLARRTELGLDAGQVSALRALASEYENTRRELERRRDEGQRQLELLLASAPLDPVATARQGAAVRALDLRIEALDREYGERALAMLGARQRERLDAGPGTDAGNLR